MTDPQDRLDAEARADDEAPTEAAPESPATVDAVGSSPPPPVDDATVDAEPVIAAASARARRPASPTRAPQPPAPYAIIETGGKQYRVSVGDSLAVERLPDEAGGDVTIDRVLLLGGSGAIRVGTPTVAGAAVTARVDDHYRGEKIVVFKYKAKKRYRRRMGHRQSLTRLTITGITG
jgi:large subunit ribosomal protein L21